MHECNASTSADYSGDTSSQACVPIRQVGVMLKPVHVIQKWIGSVVM
jgi:hypothetical protein